MVGSRPSSTRRALIDAVRDSVHAGIEALKPGVTLAHVARRCDYILASSAYARRYGMPRSPMCGVWGHGLVGAQPEDNVLVTTAGVELLTPAAGGSLGGLQAQQIRYASPLPGPFFRRD